MVAVVAMEAATTATDQGRPLVLARRRPRPQSRAACRNRGGGLKHGFDVREHGLWFWQRLHT